MNQTKLKVLTSAQKKIIFSNSFEEAEEQQIRYWAAFTISGN